MVIEFIQSFLDSLPPAFNTDTRAVEAFSVSHADSDVECTVDGATLYLRPAVLFRTDQTLDLAGKTVSQIVAEINTIDNYTATVISSSDTKCMRLLDGITTNKLYVFDNINYAIAKAFAIELADAQAAVFEGVRQTIIQSATSAILDYYGSYFDVTRESDESDAAYGQRILDSIRKTRANNKSIEISIKSLYGLETWVIDCTGIIVDEMLMWDPTQNPINPIGTPAYPLWHTTELDLACTFTVNFQDWFISTWTFPNVRKIARKINQIKAAGTTWIMHTGDIGGAMLMNCPFTPICDTNLLPIFAIYEALKYEDGPAVVAPYTGTFWLGAEDHGSLIVDGTDIISLVADSLYLNYWLEDECFITVVDEDGHEIEINLEKELEEPIIGVLKDYDKFLGRGLNVYEKDLLEA